MTNFEAENSLIQSEYLNDPNDPGFAFNINAKRKG
jgi:hypothetical protein